MKAEELRIGNYLLSAISGLPFQITIDDLVIIESGESKAKPIPLTEEWLVKFIEIKWISKDVHGIFYWFNGEKKYLKFVHSLQNIYYCIENKELILHSNK